MTDGGEEEAPGDQGCGYNPSHRSPITSSSYYSLCLWWFRRFPFHSFIATERLTGAKIETEITKVKRYTVNKDRSD